MTIKYCEQCGCSFQVSGRARRFCSTRCWYAYCRSPEKQREKFWNKVSKDHPAPVHLPDIGNCWQWNGASGEFGHGIAIFEGRNRQAHHVSWFVQFGAWPDEQLCHRCDNPKCVRPDHLFEGSQADNMRDMRDKGRGSPPPVWIGESNKSAKLTKEDVLIIRAEGGPGMYSKLGRRFGVSHVTIRDVFLRKRWRHV